MLQDGPAHHIVGMYLNSGLGTTAAHEWPDSARAPGGDVARLCRVGGPEEKGVAAVVDIRKPVQFEMEYEALPLGYVLSPYFDVYTQEGVQAFVTADLDPLWQPRPRLAGRYVSTAWIPGNLLAEGTLFVGVGLATMDPVITQFRERDVVAFQVVDTLDGDSARGDWAGLWGEVMRPLLKWSTSYTPNGNSPR